MLTVPYTLQYHRPFQIAEGDVCVSWRSLFLTVLLIRAQMCVEDLKTQIPHPHPKQNQKKKEKKTKKGKKNTLMGPFMQIRCSAFLF